MAAQQQIIMLTAQQEKTSENLFYKTKNLESLQESYYNLKARFDEQEETINNLPADESIRLKLENNNLIISKITLKNGELKTKIELLYNNNKTLAEGNSELAAKIKQLSEENGELKTAITRLAEENDKLQTRTGGSSVIDFNKLREENLALTQKIAEQENLIKDYEEDLDFHVRELEIIRKKLYKLENN